MKSFDMQRFLKTLKWIIIENKHKLTLWTAASTLGVFLLEMFFFYMNSPFTDSESYWKVVMVVVGTCSFFITLAALISVSGLFSEFSTKQRRVSLLMLPASNLEKFLSAVIYSSVVSVACILLAFAVGDTLRMLTYTLFFHQPLYSGVGEMARDLFAMSHNTISMGYWQLMLLEVLAPIFFHATYILGGSLFRKWPFLLITTVQIVVTMLGSMLMMFFFRHFDFSFVENFLNETTGKILYYVFCLLLATVSALFYWLSYRIFCRMQVIGRKWVNV